MNVKVGQVFKCVDKNHMLFNVQPVTVSNVFDGHGVKFKGLSGYYDFDILNGLEPVFTVNGVTHPLSTWEEYGWTEETLLQSKEKPNFDDLIDVAVQAYKDGVINDLHFRSESVSFSHAEGSSIFGNNLFVDCIARIQSLYKETFVIETIEQLQKLKIDSVDSITLSNGEKLTDGLINVLSRYDDSFAYPILKGATVEQAK